MANMVKQYASFLVVIFTTIFISFAEDKKFDEELDKYLPNNRECVVKHFYYDVKFNEKTKTPEWVMYRLTERNTKHITNRNGKRFVRDPDLRIKDKTPSPNSYKYSGFDRGHMCPADDMEFSDTASQETFYMSNICPQLPSVNRGDWKELEFAVRKLANKGHELIVVSGPIYTKGIEHIIIGEEKIIVPDSFFKIIYDATNEKMIGIIMDNQDPKKKRSYLGNLTKQLLKPLESSSPIDKYIVPVSLIERKVKIDFFKNITNEKQLENQKGSF